jgi:hypothetical protein
MIQGILIRQGCTAGNAPTMMHRDLLALIVEDWYDIALRMKNDPAANKAFGWILEMFAFSIAASQAPDGPLEFDLHGESAHIIVQRKTFISSVSC